MNTSNSLQTKGYVGIQYPKELRTAVTEMMELWRQFCSLPDAEKQAFTYSNGSAGVGYEKKGAGTTGPSHDQKENFDITSAGLSWISQHGLSVAGDEHSVAHMFLSKAALLVGKLKDPVLAFARYVEHTCDLAGFEAEVAKRDHAYFLRFIHYFDGVNVGIETAEAHTDQSGFTLHLYESAPGLQYLDFNKVWQPMPVTEGETVIIPSMQLQHRSKGVATALVHRVISTEETARVGRYSAVCFIQLGGPVYNKVKGRLQDLHKQNLGFNYGMPHEEFQNFFMEV